MALNPETADHVIKSLLVKEHGVLTALFNDDPISARNLMLEMCRVVDVEPTVGILTLLDLCISMTKTTLVTVCEHVGLDPAVELKLCGEAAAAVAEGI